MLSFDYAVDEKTHFIVQWFVCS